MNATIKPAIKSSEEFPIDINFLILEDMDNIRQQMVSDLKSLGVRGDIFQAATVQDAIKI